MNLWIRNGRILDPSQDMDRVSDLYITDGRIASQPASDARQIDARGKWVAPGLIDLHVHLRDPGLTYKETIETGSKAAAAGGFTTICAMPNTKPVTDTPQTVAYIYEQSQKAPYTHVLPIGAVTMGQQGKVLTDARALKEAGVCALSEDGRSVADEDLMRQAMLKAKEAGLPIFYHCEDADLAKQGDSRAAENVMTLREIKLAEETGAVLHICHVSTKESAGYVKEAREKGLAVTAEVTPHHFALYENDQTRDDHNCKMNPPLRRKEDVEAMKEALRSKVITCISTDHAPHADYEKQLPYAKAANGIVGLETSLPVSLTTLVPDVLSPLELIRVMSTNPARILANGKGTLAVGAPADVVIIDADTEYTIDKNTFFTKGRNCPYNGWKVRGKAIMTILDGKIVYENGRILS